MKALSMMQPYAWLFANGFLTTDDRTWPTAYRGPLAIHASKSFHAQYYAFLLEHTDWALPEPLEFEQGGVVGLATLAQCSQPRSPRSAPMRNLDLRRAHFGAPGHYGFVLENLRSIEFLPFRGNRGLFDVPDQLLAGR